MDLETLLNQKMKHMEISPNSRRKISVDAIESSQPSKVSVENIRMKYHSDTNENVHTSHPMQDAAEGDIEIRFIRNKDRTVDAGDPLGERAVIFSKKEGIIGFQG